MTWLRKSDDAEIEQIAKFLVVLVNENTNQADLEIFTRLIMIKKLGTY